MEASKFYYKFTIYADNTSVTLSEKNVGGNTETFYMKFHGRQKLLKQNPYQMSNFEFIRSSSW